MGASVSLRLSSSTQNGIEPVSDGINLALFNPEQAVGGGVELYSVAKVSVQVAASK